MADHGVERTPPRSRLSQPAPAPASAGTGGRLLRRSPLGISQPFAEGRVDEVALRRQDEPDQVAALDGLYGIGPASIGMIMFDVFHRWGHLTQISPWEQKIYTHIFFGRHRPRGLVPVETMMRRFARWGEWKGLAIHYAWEDLWWRRRTRRIPWLEELIRL